MTAATVYYTDNGGRGWATVELQARLMARLFEADLVRLDASGGYSKAALAAGLLPRRRASGFALVIAPAPAHLNAVLSAHALRRAHEFVAGWVVDSFWTERIPRIARHRGAFDHLFVTDAELVDVWRTSTGTATTWLPFASDVLDHGSAGTDRPVDLQRIGRMPATWDDDRQVGARAESHGLRYAGRTQFFADPLDNQRGLLQAASRAVFTVAFSNTAAPAEYTHPNHEYLTGRWTDSLACGAVVAGIAPRCQATRELLWDGALLELESVDLDQGLAAVRSARDHWTPDSARRNYAMALQRLDWRRRAEVISTVSGRSTPTLIAELARLELAITEAGPW
jgi:hypothetical protein